MTISRREVLKGIMAGSAAVIAGAAGADRLLAQAAEAPPKSPVKYEVKPLRFDPGKLNGISERLIVSHHDNNYAAAVKNLNAAEAQIAAAGKDTPAFVLGGMKFAELTFSNSVILHEHYFDNLGGSGKRSGRIEGALGGAFGSLANWESQFRAAAMSLGGGSGWLVLYYNHHTGQIRNYWSNHHTLALGFGQPLLVLDMFEHAYQMDYGAAHARYIDAYFNNINWDVVNQRLEKAEAVAKLLTK